MQGKGSQRSNGVLLDHGVRRCMFVQSMCVGAACQGWWSWVVKHKQSEKRDCPVDVGKQTVNTQKQRGRETDRQAEAWNEGRTASGSNKVEVS